MKLSLFKYSAKNKTFPPLKISKCFDNLDLDITDFESAIGFLTDEITLNNADLVITKTLALCTSHNPNWRYLAGRLFVYFDLIKKQNLRQKDGIIQRLVANNSLKDYYTKSDLATAVSWIVHDRDFDYDYAGAFLLVNRYLGDDEFIQERYLTCALWLASNEKPQNKLILAKQYYDAISLRKISLATPLLLNLGTRYQNLASCFIVSVEDTLESIFAQITNLARISTNGGGAGICLSKLRSAKSSLRGKKGLANGVIPWIKIINDTACAVNQNGKRAGAVTVALDVWHNDIIDFLDLQTEHGDARRKAFDIFPQVVIPDAFMQAADRDLDWYLVDPYEVLQTLNIDLPSSIGVDFDRDYSLVQQAILDGKITNYRQLKAKDLLKLILRSQIETGLPYLFFKDAANRANPNKHDGYIPCANLCTESYSNVSNDAAHVCNLISLNLANIENELEIEFYSDLAVQALDAAIDLNIPSFAEAKEHNDRYRVIGVGIMGVADWLAKTKQKFTDTQAISHLVETIAFHTTWASMQLAKAKGAYPKFEGSEWEKGKLLGSVELSDILERSTTFLNWEKLQSDIQTYGIRNSQIMAIAPNTSSSLLQGCTPGCLPIYAKFYYDKFGKASVPIAPPFIDSAFWYYLENKHTNQTVVINAVAEMQRWIDTGISMELLYNFNTNTYGDDTVLSAKDLYDNIFLAWQKGLKAIYYTRSVQSTIQKSECVSCAN